MDHEPHGFRWDPPPPRELPALREHLADYLCSLPAHLFTAEVLRQGRGTLRPVAEPEVGAELLLRDEHRRLSQAQLFYVTPEITQLVRQSAPSLKESWDIQPHDIPAVTGFMLFAGPLAEYIREDGKQVSIVAVSWGHSKIVFGPPEGLWITFWSVTDFAAITRLARTAGVPAAEAMKLARAQHAELTWDNEIYMPWGASQPTFASEGAGGRAIDPTRLAAARSTIEWLQTVHAGWIFCLPNTLTEMTEEHLPRTQRIRAERAGHHAAPVRVVSMSRRSRQRTGSGDNPGGRTVGVRFPVAPFFRRQAYGPGRSLRRWTPVVGHWRGPVDAPVQITKKVNLVDNSPPVPEIGGHHERR